MTDHIAMPLVSIIMPTFDAGATVAAAVRSVLVQGHASWELLIVADDDQDYAAILGAAGIADPRLRFLRTGAPGSGPARARNIALEAAKGTLVAPLDADDDWAANRLSELVTLAERHGAVCDNTGVWRRSNRRSHMAFTAPLPARLDARAILECGVPLFPVFRRELTGEGWPDVPFAEDVLFNLMLLEAAEAYVLRPRALYRYRIRETSLSHGPEAWRRADAGYERILAGLDSGRWLHGSALRDMAIAGFRAKRGLNREFAVALEAGEAATFQEFLARRRAS